MSQLSQSYVKKSLYDNEVGGLYDLCCSPPPGRHRDVLASLSGSPLTHLIAPNDATELNHSIIFANVGTLTTNSLPLHSIFTHKEPFTHSWLHAQGSADFAELYPQNTDVWMNLGTKTSVVLGLEKYLWHLVMFWHKDEVLEFKK